MLWSRYLAPHLILVVVACACNSNPAGPSAGSSKEAFFAALRQQGASVTPGQMLSRESTPYFEVPAQIVQVNTGTINVFEYGDAAAAGRDAAKVSPDGSSVGNTSILWIGPPHFYRNDRLIVVYAGHSLAVLQPLEAVLGPPFAH
ncbi:MAG TPA: hypothetical protein VES67_20300 [Vicinamibacterales bacterium]|nr:hypothetical protein [Vicinamibacterales bacterium]